MIFDTLVEYCKQPVAYYPIVDAAEDGSGQKTFTTPVRLLVRGGEKSAQVVDKNGNTFNTNTTVTTSLPQTQPDGSEWPGAAGTFDELAALKELSVICLIPRGLTLADMDQADPFAAANRKAYEIRPSGVT